MSIIAKRLQKAMEIRGMKQIDLVNATGIGKSSISTYLSGEYEPKQRNIYKLAKALEVNEAWLLGFDDVPMDIPEKETASVPLPANIIPLPKTKKIPLLGSIACGTPILAQENIEAELDISENINADFALRCKGDSMTGARILNGDIVYIRQQPDVNNGEIAAVLIDEEATLKRVYKYPDKLILNAENPSFPPLIYSGAELEQIRIIGKAVSFTSTVK